MKQAFLTFCLLGTVLVVWAGAMEPPSSVYQPPDLAPAYSIWMGGTIYGQSGVDGSGSVTRAAAYDYLQDAFSAGGSLSAPWDPFYVFVSGEFKNENDYFGDVRFAYGDLFTSRWIGRRLYHNLENLELLFPDVSNPLSGIDIRDSDRAYGLRTDINHLALRLHPVNFPLYLYANGFRIDHNGAEQQRFLGGSGYFNDLQRTSVSRTVDDKSVEVNTGFNVHLGPVELDYAHADLDYSSDGDVFLLYPFGAAGVREPGVYEVGRIPAITGFSDTLRCHTNYGGRVYAGTSLGWIKRKNEFSRVEADYRVFQGEILWMPWTKLRLVTKYRWRQTDTDQPDMGKELRAGNDTEASRFTAQMRYRLMRRTTARVEFVHDSLERGSRFAEDWGLADSVDKSKLILGVDTRPWRALRLKVQYAHSETDQQSRHAALGIVPARSDEGKLTLSWNPLSRLTALLRMSAARDEKENLRMLDEAGLPVPDALHRDALAQSVFGSISWGINDKLWVTPSYVYRKNSVEQDLAYNAWPPARPLIDRWVRSTDTAHHYAVDVDFMPRKTISIETRCSYTKSKGSFSPGLSEALSAVSIASYAGVDTEALSFESRLEYALSDRISISGTYGYSDYEESAQGTTNDGDYHRFQMALTRKW